MGLYGCFSTYFVINRASHVLATQDRGLNHRLQTDLCKRYLSVGRVNGRTPSTFLRPWLRPRQQICKRAKRQLPNLMRPEKSARKRAETNTSQHRCPFHDHGTYHP